MKVIFVLAAVFAVAKGQSGNGQTTRYWDCCKPSCAWPGKGPVDRPVDTCQANGQSVHNDPNARSVCDGGPSHTCTNNAPWQVDNNLAYGFAAVRISGQQESNWCCACYELTFTSGPINGKRMIVQATNTGGDLGNDHFDILMPGGGFGLFDGCTPQWGNSYQWGQRYGGVTSRAGCNNLPPALQAGCQWRFDWFGGADNPNVSWRRVACPAAITQKSRCNRSDSPF